MQKIKRLKTTPRPSWQNTVEHLGFNFHSLKMPYWDESVYYQISSAKAIELARISEELHSMCLELVDVIIKGKAYGRFDFALDTNHCFKMLEYNADTPEMILETGLIQKQWQAQCFKDAGQLNQLESELIKRWQWLKQKPGFPDVVHFMTLTEYKESKANIVYMANLAKEAGLATQLLSAHDFLWDHDARQFSREDARRIHAIFKIYPWEWMFASSHGLLQAPEFYALEPPWKYLLSNKAMLALLWKLFPDHPNLLPTYFIPEAFTTPVMKKACCSRNSESVFYCQDPNTTQDYGSPLDRFIYQGVCQTKTFDQHFPIFGMFMVDSNAAGLGIREDSSLINTDANRFVPHTVI